MGDLPGASASIPSAGDTFTIPYPFVRETFEEFGCDPLPTWRPGVRYEDVGPEDAGAVADALGTASFTVEGVYKPGRFPTRVFFTRKFATPDGHVFGKTKLHITTLGKFRRLTKGYQHQFGIGEPLELRYGWKASREIFEDLLREAASAIEARRAETENTGSVEDESATRQGDAQ